VLEKYINSFIRLRTDKNRKRWSALTAHQAPHKPFLLLSIMDLIAQGAITGKFIEPSLELLETFNIYFANIMPAGSKGIMSYPFYHMRTEPFWHLMPNKGYKDQPGLTISSMVKLREIYAGAEMDDELFRLMCNPESGEQLRAVIVNTYFAPEIRHSLFVQGHINYEAYQYSEKLLKVAENMEAFITTEESEQKKRIRDQGFRKAIVTLYKHRCALCGIRMLTPEGHTIVDAAHVKPWKESFDDSPTNGMALCKLCHWSFDKGLMSVGKDYEVLVSKRVQVEQNLPGHILTLSDRSIFTPDEQNFWPTQDNLAWHRKRVFRLNFA
jgi:putative restriction endonuclease